MSVNAVDSLRERGFIKQCTNIDGLYKLFDTEIVTAYIGADPTYVSLHIGHMVPLFALKHIINCGHRGILLIGGGTARIGDPSGKNEMRKLLSYSEIDLNADAFLKLLKSFFTFDGKSTILENNKKWLENLNYLEFLYAIGQYFSVNKMLSFDAYKTRMQSELSFIEFNYQLLQSFDFLELNRMHNCKLQIGGDDQWGNIVAGIDLIRRVNDEETFGLTFPLIMTAEGRKMGKSESGAIFIDPKLTNINVFYNYWLGVAAKDVERFLLMFTLLPIDDCKHLASEDIQMARNELAFQVTAHIHGIDAAEAAKNLAHSNLKCK